MRPKKNFGEVEDEVLDYGESDEDDLSLAEEVFVKGYDDDYDNAMNGG